MSPMSQTPNYLGLQNDMSSRGNCYVEGSARLRAFCHVSVGRTNDRKPGQRGNCQQTTQPCASGANSASEY